MLKDTKSLDNNKAPACESRGFVHKKRKVCILTQLLLLSFSYRYLSIITSLPQIYPTLIISYL